MRVKCKSDLFSLSWDRGVEFTPGPDLHSWVVFQLSWWLGGFIFDLGESLHTSLHPRDKFPEEASVRRVGWHDALMTAWWKKIISSRYMKYLLHTSKCCPPSVLVLARCMSIPVTNEETDSGELGNSSRISQLESSEVRLEPSLSVHWQPAPDRSLADAGISQEQIYISSLTTGFAFLGCNYAGEENLRKWKHL